MNSKIVAIPTLLLSMLSIPIATALTFNIDFGRDGIYENSLNLGFNETTWADIYISEVDSPGLVSMGFELDYNSSALEILNAKVVGWDIFNVSFNSSSLTMTGGMLSDTRIGNDILLASVELKAIATTNLTTAFTLDDIAGSDDFVTNNGISSLDSQLSSISLPPIIVAGSSIPQPGSLVLLAAGLFGLAIAKNRIELRTQE